ncbi:TetR/AcrR family transcriptional regulator [Microbacterium sp. Clip185]|uniref:TetR/AcrR family transcriptional regulator n=1 Tax=Microbacterium sp. Clip185 TaxID=3025663 RepID=UPI002365A9DC|nr:TetR/AcrR family transcriptional regulator [Microbacterium sp. Clip185]WDG17807.1 helix-turn-helix domain containing protein [Microbacterium sp. Clip185]
MARTIAAAAVDLFEEKGFSATTIDDIAAAAGISRTTFFRHSATKEAAVLVDDAGLEAELLAAAGAADTDPLAHLEHVWEGMSAVFDEDPAGRDRFLRVRRLMRENPPLLAAGLARDAQLSDRIAAALSESLPDDLGARAVAAVFSLGMRLSFDEWVRRADGDPRHPPSLTEVYADVRAALARTRGTLS